MQSIPRLLLAGWLFCASAMAMEAIAQTFSIDAHIVSSGSSAHLRSSCFRMSATIGEPVAGFSSSTDYTLNAGYAAVAPMRDDAIFFTGFEDCTP